MKAACGSGCGTKPRHDDAHPHSLRKRSGSQSTSFFREKASRPCMNRRAFKRNAIRRVIDSRCCRKNSIERKNQQQINHHLRISKAHRIRTPIA
jgi:hypothetical protein